MIFLTQYIKKKKTIYLPDIQTESQINLEVTGSK